MTFKNLGLSSELLENLKKQGYENPFQIQVKAIPAIIDGKDLLGIAATGSGKTASFVLPTLMKTKALPPLPSRHVKVLTLVPTRELANQVAEVFSKLGEGLPGVKTLAVYGGVSINPQMKALQHVDILVATPGRLLDLLENNAIKLNKISTLIIDEADKMLNLGFKEEMDKIIQLLPSKRQNLLFSATLNDDVSKINQLVLSNPLVIQVAEEKITPEVINQSAYLVNQENKGPLLRYLINKLNMSQVLVFASTGHKADNIAFKLNKNGIEAEAIHGKKGQIARIQSLGKFKNKQLRVLVSTDLLARGIDISSLPYVINFDLPRSPKDYIHRIGRTGRAESEGEAISFVTEEDKGHFKVIKKKAGVWLDLINANELDL